MTRVTTPLRVQYIDGDRWLVLEEFRCCSEIVGEVVIPVGFITDFNSTPRLLWNLVPPTEYGEAALPHDLLYRTGRLNGEPIDRQTADRVHREFMLWRGAPAWKAAAMYAGLRLGGWYPWRRYRRAEAEATVSGG